MYEQVGEMQRLMREGTEAADKKQYAILRVKMVALDHARTAAARIIQIQAQWNRAARPPVGQRPQLSQ